MTRPLVLLFAAMASMWAYEAHAALGPSESEALAGRRLPDVEAVLIDGRAFSFAELRGSPVVIEVFTSWCAVCQAQNDEISALLQANAQRGLRVLGVLADAVETPDTVAEARKMLRDQPPPYPVVLLNPRLQEVLGYVGFPATYTVGRDGKFQTTLYGYHDRARLDGVVSTLLAAAPADAELGTSVSSPSKSADSQGATRMPWERSAVQAFVPRWWKQWHPFFVHFPIAFLVLETVLLLIWSVRRSDAVAHLAHLALGAGLVTGLLAIVTGLSDVGATVGPGWALWNGIVDRSRHLFRLESTVSLHVLLATASLLLAGVRFGWRHIGGRTAMSGLPGFGFVALSLLGLWSLLAAGQVGGGLSHG